MCTKKVYKCFFFSVGNYACVLLDGGDYRSVHVSIHTFTRLVLQVHVMLYSNSFQTHLGYFVAKRNVKCRNDPEDQRRYEM